MRMLLGYARVSTGRRGCAAAAGVIAVASALPWDAFSDVTSGRRAAVEWPLLKKRLDWARAGGRFCGV